MSRPTDFLRHRQLPTSLADLKRLLTSVAAQTLDQLTHVLAIPDDAPRLSIALAAVCNAVAAYGAMLHAPNALFRLIQEHIERLRAEVVNDLGLVVAPHELEQPLLRRLVPHSPYALCLSLGSLPADQSVEYLAATGVEIALCMANAKAFAKGYSNDLRREVTPKLFGVSASPNNASPWKKSAAKKLKLAAQLFEQDGPPDPSTTNDLRIFDLRAGFELSRKMRYSPPRQRQALLDRHHLAEWQLRTAASQILMRAQAGDQTALLTMLAFVAGLSLPTAKEMPLAQALAGSGAVMALDLEQGVIMTNLGRLAPDAAVPHTEAKIFRECSQIAVKPLPDVVIELLRRLAYGQPSVATVSEILPEALTSGRQPTIEGDMTVLNSTTARFLASAAPYAVIYVVSWSTEKCRSGDRSFASPEAAMYFVLSPMMSEQPELFHFRWASNVASQNSDLHDQAVHSSALLRHIAVSGNEVQVALIYHRQL